MYDDSSLQNKKAKMKSDAANDYSNSKTPQRIEYAENMPTPSDDSTHIPIGTANHQKSSGFYNTWDMDVDPNVRQYSNWDFSQLSFPDLSSLSLLDQTEISLSIPPSHLLPHVNPENHSHFTISSKSLAFNAFKETAACGALEFSFPIVKPKITTKARNWKEYKNEIAQRNDKDIMTSTAGSVLWSEDDVRPLVSPLDATCTGNLKTVDL